MGPHATERVSPVRGGRGRIRSPSRDPWDEVSGGGLVGPTGAVPRPEMLACVWRAAVRCKAQGAGAVIGGRGGRHRRRADRVSVDCGGDAWLGRLCVPTCCLRAPDARLGWGKSVGAGLGLLDDTRAAQKGRAGVLRTGRVARDVGAFVSRRVVCAHLMRALDGADVSVPDCGFAKVRVRPRWGGRVLANGAGGPRRGRLGVPACRLRAPDARLGRGRLVCVGLGHWDSSRVVQKGVGRGLAKGAGGPRRGRVCVPACGLRAPDARLGQAVWRYAGRGKARGARLVYGARVDSPVAGPTRRQAREQACWHIGRWRAVLVKRPTGRRADDDTRGPRGHRRIPTLDLSL